MAIQIQSALAAGDFAGALKILSSSSFSSSDAQEEAVETSQAGAGADAADAPSSLTSARHGDDNAPKGDDVDTVGQAASSPNAAASSSSAPASSSSSIKQQHQQQQRLSPQEKRQLQTYIIQQWLNEALTLNTTSTTGTETGTRAEISPELIGAVRKLAGIDSSSSSDRNGVDGQTANDVVDDDRQEDLEDIRLWIVRACCAAAAAAAGGARVEEQEGSRSRPLSEELIPLGLEVLEAVRRQRQQTRSSATETEDEGKGKQPADELDELQRVLEDAWHVQLLAFAADGKVDALLRARQSQPTDITLDVLDALPLHLRPEDDDGVGKLVSLVHPDADWLERRARAVVEAYGLRDVALEWARLAVQATVNSDAPASRLVKHLETLIRRRLPDDWTLGRSERGVSEQEVLDASRDLRGLPSERLHAYLLSSSLERTLEIFEQSKATLPIEERVITSDLDVARLALARLYGAQETDRWTVMSRIFECLPVWDTQSSSSSDSEITTTTLESLAAYVEPSTDRPPPDASSMMLFFAPLPFIALSRALDILDVHLESGEILARWHVPASLQTFLRTAFDVEEQRGWATRMARTARPRPSDDQEWIALRDDMCKLAGGGEGLLRGAFGLLDRQEVLAIFYGGLLAAGKFKLCKSLILQSSIPISPATLESLVIGASHEFYDNGSLSSASDVLSVASPTQAIRHFRSFIDATRRIIAVTDLAPVEIRHATNRLDLIRRVSHLDPDTVLELARGLGIEGQLPVLCMIAESSPTEEIGDRIIAELQQQQQQQVRHPKPDAAAHVTDVWKTLAMLGRQTDLDVAARARFLGRALESCPPEDIQALLVSWRRVEEGQLRLSDAASYRRKARIPEPPLPAQLSSTLSRFRSASPARSDAGSTASSVHLDAQEIRQHARKALVKGVGWLLGANETSPRL